LPQGIEPTLVADQAATVDVAINDFMTSLWQAIVIILACSFVALGVRPGTVVALAIPLTMAIVFAVMDVANIDLHRISLGALIIALGLLVDDAIIAVEMMVVKMEQGWEKSKAAAFAYTSTAFPMLTGTLITAAGFLPVGFARSAAGEYTFSIFVVVGIALLTSWVAAVVFIPWLGSRLLNREKLMAKAAKHAGEFRSISDALAKLDGGEPENPDAPAGTLTEAGARVVTLEAALRFCRGLLELRATGDVLSARLSPVEAEALRMARAALGEGNG
jgi:multidrug efflux pump